MPDKKESILLTENIKIESDLLRRAVEIDCFIPTFTNDRSSLDLLLINDGQNMEELGLAAILEDLMMNNKISPLCCIAIHAGNRFVEYGTANKVDYKGRGHKASLYTRFIFEELLPVVKSTFLIPSFRQQSFAGFSLGGLSALDIVWNHPHQFNLVGVFSGSLWWRTKNLNEGYNEDTDRIMHANIRNGNYAPCLKFFFQAGKLDETMDRNQNGIIDSIDDTLGLIEELVKKGYHPQNDISYLQLEDGKHDIKTWARAMPEFLRWGWGI